jgi:hypothetical protein
MFGGLIIYKEKWLKFIKYEINISVIQHAILVFIELIFIIKFLNFNIKRWLRDY